VLKNLQQKNAPYGKTEKFTVGVFFVLSVQIGAVHFRRVFSLLFGVSLLCLMRIKFLTVHFSLII
jgi:hypothetical protein